MEGDGSALIRRHIGQQIGKALAEPFFLQGSPQRGRDMFLDRLWRAGGRVKPVPGGHGNAGRSGLGRGGDVRQTSKPRRAAHGKDLYAIVANIGHGIRRLIAKHINAPGHEFGNRRRGAAKHHRGGPCARRLLHQ